MLCSVDIPRSPDLFLREVEEQWIWGSGGELGGVEGGKTVWDVMYKRI